MKLDDFEKKILISGLGIIVLILIFYFIHEKSKSKESLVVGLAVGDFLSDMYGIFTSFVSPAVTFAQTTATGAAGMAQTAVMGAAGIAQTGATFGAKVAMDVATKVSQQASAAASHAKTAIRQQTISYKDKMVARVNKLKEKIMDKKKELIKDYKAKIKEVKTTRRILKYGYILSRIFSKIGRWAMKTVAIIIRRIANLKSCFIWYALEIIGWILYLPMEFFVWFFCLQSMEKNFFGLVKDFDCFFNGVMGFHIFYYSDYIRNKCFVPHLPPFPYSAGGGLFTKKGMMNLMKEIFLPPSPIDMARHVQQGLLEYKKELLDTFKKPQGFDIKAIWAEAMDLVSLISPNGVEQSGSIPNDDSDEQANNGAVISSDIEDIPIAGGTDLSDADLALPPEPTTDASEFVDFPDTIDAEEKANAIQAAQAARVAQAAKNAQASVEAQIQAAKTIQPGQADYSGYNDNMVDTSYTYDNNADSVDF